MSFSQAEEYLGQSRLGVQKTVGLDVFPSFKQSLAQDLCIIEGDGHPLLNQEHKLLTRDNRYPGLLVSGGPSLGMFLGPQQVVSQNATRINSQDLLPIIGVNSGNPDTSAIENKERIDRISLIEDDFSLRVNSVDTSRQDSIEIREWEPVH
jgi:hypothetical protein